MIDIGFEIIPLFILLISSVFILIASFRVFKANNVPGSKYIFFSISGTLFGFVIYIIYMFIPSDSYFQIIEQAIDFYLAIIFALGAKGFWSLSNYVSKINTSN